MTDVQLSDERVFERIDDAFFALDTEWRFTFLNGRAAEVLDVDRERVIGNSVWEEFDPAVDTTFQEQYKRAMETQEPVSFEEHYEPLETWFEVTAYPGDDGLSVYFRDVTDRVERTRELERYERIVETAQDGIYVVDGDGHFRMVNDSYAELLGYDPADLEGRHVTDVVDAETAARAAELDRQLKAGERDEATIEGTLERADGATFEAEATFAVLPDGHRVGVVRDVSERHERQRQLTLYERVVANAGDGVYAIDEDHEFLMVNDAFCELTGYDREDLLGERATLVKDEQVIRWADRLLAQIERGEREEATIEFELRTRSGDRIPVQSPIDRFELDDGAGRCGIVRDVSERHEREDELHRRIAEQKVVTELGRRALEERDLDALMDDAARLVAETLDIDHCKVLDLDAEAEELLLRQGVGWDEGVVGEATVSAAAEDSQAAYTLAEEGPVVVEDLDSETRFSGPALLTDHDVSSGISTIIGPFDDPWGILGAHDTEVTEFPDHAVNFLESVANVLAGAIARHEDEQALRSQRDRLSALNDINSLVHSLSESMFGLSSCSDIRELVCERLAASDSYEFAWIGTVRDGEVVVETEAGVEDYLDDITLAVDEAPANQGPTVQAHETGEMQVVRDVHEDERYTQWTDRAEAYGFCASASIPLIDGDGIAGTLNVYSSRSDAFGAEERDALRRLGSIIAYALSSVERDRKLQRERNRLEFMNRLLRHNLLNSLNVVKARLDMLEGRVDYEVSNHLEIAFGRTREMIEFVETIRDVTKVIGRGDEQDLKPRDIGDVLETRVESARGAYPEATFHLEAVPRADVVADELLGELLDNVLANAVQHNPDDHPTVWVDATVREESVVVSVADDGPGIPDDRKSTVFDRESKDFEDPGSGFGLYLVKEIMDSYGGDIVVEDNVPEGALFRLTFRRP